MRNILLTILGIVIFSSCHQEENITVEIDVVLHTKENHTSPLVITVENKTKSASSFLWTFEGGEPTSSTQRNPGNIRFTEPGEHTITLEAWNDGDKTSQIYSVRVDSAVTANFNAVVDINDYAPAQFNITNLSTGGSIYKWIFEGGEPTSYEGKQPPSVTYANKGKYSIILVVDNGSELFTTDKEIEVKEGLEASFSIIPSFEDIDDMEAPLRATFDTQLQGVENVHWECTGATITNPDSKDAKILFRTAGTYTVNLNISNGKGNKIVSQNIIVKENTNLRTHKDIKLGISTAQESIGSLYSTKLRQVVKSSQINSVNGPLIDIAYVGFNAEFTHNFFVSPDKVSETVLTDIPNAKATKFINKTELGSISLTPVEFTSMINDNLLKSLPIMAVSYGDEYFTVTTLPRVVLFETADGRKGAILIKEVVRGGKDGSYIIADIKVQKND